MLQKLWSFLDTEVSRSQEKSARTGSYLVAVEHEFFLLDQLGLPCTFEQSQEFLRLFGERTNARLFLSAAGHVARVGLDRDSGSYGSLKYDHEPHLLEYASSFYSSLTALETELRTVFYVVQSVQRELGLELAFKPALGISPAHPRTQSSDSEYENLRRFRRKVQNLLGVEPKAGSENYAAVIASTQVNISLGDCLWTKNPNFVPNLYQFERKILPFATMFTGFDQRWRKYNSVYQGYKLLGFPELQSWSVENWLEACLESYVFDKNSSEPIPFKTLVDREHGELAKGWKALRDLQIIKPKLTGAIEFRADPCQASIDQIMALTALRLGVNFLCAGRNFSRDRFSDERRAWWDAVTKMDYGTPDIDFLENVTKHLELSAHDSIKYLALYRGKGGCDAA